MQMDDGGDWCAGTTLRGGGDPGDMYNVYLILKIVLQKSCLQHSWNITLFATSSTNVITSFMTHLPNLYHKVQSASLFNFIKDILLFISFLKFLVI